MPGRRPSRYINRSNQLAEEIKPPVLYPTMPDPPKRLSVKKIDKNRKNLLWTGRRFKEKITDLDLYQVVTKGSKKLKNDASWTFNNWESYPRELQNVIKPDDSGESPSKNNENSPKAKKKKEKKIVKVKSKEGLEEKVENDEHESESESSEDSDEEAAGNTDSLSEEEDPEQKLDEEEGADYVSSYFDNGEAYLDEDDDDLSEGGHI